MTKTEDGHGKNINGSDIHRKQKQREADRFAVDLIVQPIADPLEILTEAASILTQREFDKGKRTTKPN